MRLRIWPFRSIGLKWQNMVPGLITVTLPASIAGDMPVVAQRLVDRMHALLERNTDGQLNPVERDELEALVEMAEFAQLVAAAVRKAVP